MKIVRQPLLSMLCGHCCISMLSGVSVKKIIKMVGRDTGTSTKEMVRVLRKLKIKSGKKLRVVSKKSSLPAKAILKIKYPKKSNWHWVVVYKGMIHDPGASRGGIYPIEKLHERYDPKVKISSYLEIFS